VTWPPPTERKGNVENLVCCSGGVSKGFWGGYSLRLKVLTNEKRDGLSVVSFNKSRFKLYSRKFSNKLVQVPSCERHKTAPRTLFLLFANYN
jgi:hypothetical protein